MISWMMEVGREEREVDAAAIFGFEFWVFFFVKIFPFEGGCMCVGFIHGKSHTWWDTTFGEFDNVGLNNLHQLVLIMLFLIIPLNDFSFHSFSFWE